MNTPLGPSVRLAFGIADGLATVSCMALKEAWDRWLGPQRFSRQLARMERCGYVEHVSKGDNLDRVVRLTEAGRLAALGGRDPEECWRRRWDAKWRLVMFDVPERDSALRVRLRRTLSGLAFGYLQHSVWISPDPVETIRAAVADAVADAGVLTFMEARPCGGETDSDLVDVAWDFSRINRNYDQYLSILGGRPRPLERKAWQDWIRTEWRAWLRAVSIDPLLPECLQPSGYLGRQAYERRQELLGAIFRKG